ncbi:MAG: glycosyltransferase family 4 protein [Oscillospiraceae bacterium]|nr:glycosyltransferase family 4 protein [Oscillospiraceae bacterium]
MIEHLNKHDIQNDVFVPTYDVNRSIVDVRSYVRVVECFKKWDRVAYYKKQRKILEAIEKTYRCEQYDCIHAYTLFSDGNVALNLSETYGIPYVVAVRNTDVNDFFRLMPHLRSRGVTIMRKASAVFFLSDSYRNQVFEKYVPKKYRDEIFRKTHIIPNGIDDFWLGHSAVGNKSLDTNNGVKLIYAGRIDRNKNIPTTQKAMAILSERGIDTSLTVIGKVEDKKEHLKIIKDTRTKYLPAMPKEKLIEEYNKADVFVMPSFTESFGLVYAEAMSQGLPVIYSEGQGFDNQFAEGTVGYHVSSDDPKSVADGIEKILASFDEISERAVLCAGKFNWEDIAKQYAVIYQGI